MSLNPLRWFRRKQPFVPNAKSSVYFMDAGRSEWTEREYGKFSEEGYIKNVIVHRAVHLLSSAAASVRFEVADAKHPVAVLLKRPNPMMGGCAFFEAVYAYRLIAGNAYIQAVKNADGVKELVVLRPDRVNVVPGRGVIPEGYSYRVGDKKRVFKVDRLTGRSDVLHVKYFHPLNDWYGLSPMEAAAYATDQHNAAGRWNQSLLQHGARPSGALIVKNDSHGEGGILHDDQYNRLKAQLNEHYMGAANSGRPMLLEGGLDWKEMSLSPKDMDFIECKNSAARDIALAFGVPPQLLGIPGDNTYSNLAEARKAMWEYTVMPMVEMLASELTNWLSGFYGGIEVGFFSKRSKSQSASNPSCTKFGRFSFDDLELVKRIVLGKTLFVGEGNFSFVLGLVKSRLISPDNIVATVFERKKDFNSDTLENYSELVALGVNTRCDVDATNLLHAFNGEKFDSIVFQFPHSGTRKPVDSKNPSFVLVRDFLSSARLMLSDNGCVLISIVDDDYYNSIFQMELAAGEAGYNTPQKFFFEPGLFPDYIHVNTREESESALENHDTFATWVFESKLT